MKKDFAKITSKLSPLIGKIRRYKLVIFFVVLFLIYSLLIFRINALGGKEPSDSDISAQLESVSRPRIDQSVIDKIQQLQDNSVPVNSLFKAARDNPFQE